MNPLLFVVTTCLFITCKHAESPNPLSSLNSPALPKNKLVTIQNSMDVLLPHKVVQTDFTLEKKDSQPWDAPQVLPRLIQIEELSKEKGENLPLSDALYEARENLKKANAYFEIKDYKQTISYYERVLDVAIPQLGEDYLYIADVYFNLGFAYGKLGDNKKAKIYLEKALPIYTANVGEDHIDVANIYFSLAVAHLKLGNHTQAKIYLEKSLPMYIANVGEDYIGVAKIYFNLAVAHLKLGNHIQAKIYFKKAFDIYKEKLGNYHFNTVRTYFVLSVLPFYPYMLAVSYGLCIAISAYASYRLPKRCRCPQLPHTYLRSKKMAFTQRKNTHDDQPSNYCSL